MQHRVNKDLILLVRQHIGRPETYWRQGAWVDAVYTEDTGETCGTSYCYAGWAVALSGFEITPGNEYVPLSFIRKVTGLDNAEIISRAGIPAPRRELTDPEIHVRDAAAVILGLDELMIPTSTYPCKCGETDCDDRPELVHAASALFRGVNSLTTIDRVISEIFETVGIERN